MNGARVMATRQAVRALLGLVRARPRPAIPAAAPPQPAAREVAGPPMGAADAAALDPWVRGAFGQTLMEECLPRGGNPTVLRELLEELGLPIENARAHV